MKCFVMAIKILCGIFWTIAIVALISEAWPMKELGQRVGYVFLGSFLIVVVWDFAMNRLFGKDS